MRKSKIWAFAQDPGGANGIIPVVKLLRNNGIDVYFIANGKAADIANTGTEHYRYNNYEHLLFDLKKSKPEIFLTSMCSTLGMGHNLVPACKTLNITTIGLLDMWWIKQGWTDHEYQTDYICTNDLASQELILKSWPGYKTSHIVLTGFPALDKYRGYMAKNNIKKLLNLSDKPIFLFAGQVHRTGENLFELVKVLNKLRFSSYLIPRMHPRMKDDAPDQLTIWKKALDNFNNGSVINETNNIDLIDLIAYADITFSMFSTVLLEATILRKANIAMLYPEIGMQQFHSEASKNVVDFPLAELKCTWKVTSNSELTTAIKYILSNGWPFDIQQKKHFPADGNNAKRVVNFINKIMG